VPHWRDDLCNDLGVGRVYGIGCTQIVYTFDVPRRPPLIPPATPYLRDVVNCALNKRASQRFLATCHELLWQAFAT
jgi:hypothetical protein